MTARNQAAAPMATTKGITTDIQQLAASYQLGTPLQAYRPTLPVAGYCGLFFALVNVCIATIGILLALFIPALRGFVGVSGIVVFLFMVAFGLLISLSALAYVRSGKTYECTEGFLEVDKDGAVKAAVRWDQIQVLWHKIFVARSGNDPHNNTYLKHTYSVGTANGGEIKVEYPQLWKRIESEFVRRHFPQALAMFNAGQRVPFNAVSVSQQGVIKETLYQPGGSMIALQDLAHVRISSMELYFEGRGAFLRLEVVRVPVSETANVCLLEALLNTVTGGRIVRIE
jgi:ABC-type transport system involved in multi-copper enzyme maturation permease subunit